MKLPITLLVPFFALLMCGFATAQRVDLVVSTIIHDDKSQTLSTRDMRQRAMRQETYTVQGVLAMKRLFLLDRQGKVLNGHASDGKDKMLYKFQYEYDQLDRLKLEKVIDMQGNVVRLLTVTYDEQGKAKKQAINNPKFSKDGQLPENILLSPEELEAKGKKVPGNQLNLPKQ